jgi:hypothetical protein
MRTLMIVILNPVIQTPTGIGKRGEHRLTQVLPPKRLPEPLDLPQRHRMMRSAPHMLDPLLLEHTLKARLPTPGDELATIVAQDLPRRTPLTDRPLQDLQHRLRRLLAIKTPADQETAVVIDDPDQVDPVEPLELEGEDVDLPHRVRQRALEAPRGRGASLRSGRWVAETGRVHHAADLLRTYGKTLFAAQLVADPTHPMLGMLAAMREDLLLELAALLANGNRRRATAHPRNPALAVLLVPLAERRGTHPDHRRNVEPLRSVLQGFDR